MTATVASPVAGTVPAARTRVTTSRLLAAGVVGGPLWVGSSLLQAFTRDGFDIRRHALSQLSLGDLGFLQVGTFLGAGALFVAAAVGARRAGAGTWLPRFLAAFGAGLLVAGAFPTDPGEEFPVGTPAGVPEQLSWHAQLHSVGFFLVMFGFAATAIAAAVWNARRGSRRWAAVCALAPVAAAVVFLAPVFGPLTVRMAAAGTLEFALVTALCAKLVRETAR